MSGSSSPKERQRTSIEVELWDLSIAAAFGLALGSKLVVELTEKTLGSKDTGVERWDMVARVKVRAKRGRNESRFRHTLLGDAFSDAQI